MRITRLRGGNAQFPGDKEIGDAVVLGSGDIFCWDGKIWQLVGGRFIPERMREEFISYISTGWPSRNDAEFDLPTLLDLATFADYGERDISPADPRMVDKFKHRVAEVAGLCEKAIKAQR